jgi:hypothetical protein
MNQETVRSQAQQAHVGTDPQVMGYDLHFRIVTLTAM